jgi:hypothetical protein
MPSLRDIQSAMHLSLLGKDRAAMNSYVVSDELSAEERLDIYRNTHLGSLSAVLRLAYPVVRKLVGDEFFDGAAEIFIRGNPPGSPYLYEYGAGFPAFLGDFEPAARLQYLRDVATLEWTVFHAMHAPDIRPLDSLRLAEISPIDQPRIVLIRHPSVSLLYLGHAAHEIWQAVLDDDDNAMAVVDPGQEPKWLLVERYDGDIRILPLPDAAAEFAAQVFAGEFLQDALNSAGENAPAYLAEHLACGRFVDLVLRDTEALDHSRSTPND